MFWYQDSRNWNELHTSLSYTTITKPDAIYLTTGRASSIPSRKGNNCLIRIVGINSNVPQVAPRTTREDPTSTAISLTQFFFLFQCRVPGTCFPQKVMEESRRCQYKMIASFTALNMLNPRRNETCSHLFSKIPGKESS